MTPSRLASLQADFSAWSGGFPPDSLDQITVYLDYALRVGQDREAARRALEEWMNNGEPYEFKDKTPNRSASEAALNAVQCGRRFDDPL